MISAIEIGSSDEKTRDGFLRERSPAYDSRRDSADRKGNRAAGYFLGVREASVEAAESILAANSPTRSAVRLTAASASLSLIGTLFAKIQATAIAVAFGSDDGTTVKSAFRPMTFSFHRRGLFGDNPSVNLLYRPRINFVIPCRIL
jgi:hypothetical protein